MNMNNVLVPMCCVLSLTVHLLAADKPVPKTPITLPDSPTAEVISLDFKGGFTPPRLKNSPSLSILRDGTVLVPDNYGQSEDVKAKLTPAELQELLTFIVDTHQFFEFQPAKVQAAIQNAERPKKIKPGELVLVAPRVSDAPTTVIKVELKDREHQAQWYALSFEASHHSKVAPLQHLRAIEQRLQRVMTVAHAGGEEEVTRQLKLVNQKVQEQYADAPLLKAEHLLSASRRADGSRAFLWQWIEQGKDGNAQSAKFVTVNQQVPASGETMLMINVKLK